ncbi:MAG: Cytochrome c4 [Stenotrophomonas maltophilia]|nr:MAG: Cytochrome c4 [Stenotrophomonas maltophilia]
MMKFATLLLCTLLLGSAQASEMMDRFNALAADPVAREKAIGAAQERILLCSQCHGKDGNSRRDYIPNLAGQNPQYLFDAFEKYVDRRRVDYVMNQAARLLTTQDRVNIAFYFSQQTVHPVRADDATADAALLERGRAKFQAVCVACHGPNGLGHDGIPRIAGQPEAYLQKALTRYRENDPSRLGSPMLAVAGMLSEDEIPALVAYLHRLDPKPGVTAGR